MPSACATLALEGGAPVHQVQRHLRHRDIRTTLRYDRAREARKNPTIEAIPPLGEWKDRTDVTVSALSKAQAGAAEMKLLEKEAQELGQPPMYSEGELDEIRQDLDLMMTFLLRNLDKRFMDNK